MRFLASLLLLAAPCFATTYNSDGSQSNVNTLIAGASSGDIVTIPSGSFTWGASAVQTTVNKAITLQGAGTGSTTITISGGSGTYTNGCISITAAATVKDFAVVNAATSVNTTPFSTGTVNGWRITNIVYTTASAADQYFCYYGSYGCIDNCSITGNTDSSELIFGRGPDDSWTTANSMGSINAVFVETCTFPGKGYVCDGNSYSRLVVRFNTGISRSNSKADAHGYASNTPAASSRQIEIYDNAWTATSGFAQIIEVRGGTARVFDNTSTNTDSSWGQFNEYGSLAQWPNFSNVYQTPTNYPVIQQVGQGLSGREPVYWFHNTIGASTDWVPSGSAPAAGAITLYGSTFYMTTEEGTPAMIRRDLDYFKYVPSGFNGSTGVGRGTKAAMNAITPSLAGVGFWVTDEGSWNTLIAANTSGQLYVWSGAAWVLNYTPYTYPWAAGGTSGGSTLLGQVTLKGNVQIK